MEIDVLVLREKDNVTTALRDIRGDKEVLVGLLDTTKKVLIHEEMGISFGAGEPETR
jgi:hypothetical protein